MKYTLHTKRLLAPTLAAVLVPGLLVGGVSLLPDVARAEVKAVACKVTAFLAQKDGDGIPKDLKFLEEQLRDDQFAAFKGFRLLETKALRLGIEKPGLAALKSGYQLKLSLLGDDGAKLKLHANLLAPGRESPLVDTDYSIDDNGLLLVGGVRHEDGKIFFAIQCGTQPS